MGRKILSVVLILILSTNQDCRNAHCCLYSDCVSRERRANSHGNICSEIQVENSHVIAQQKHLRHMKPTMSRASGGTRMQTSIRSGRGSLLGRKRSTNPFYLLQSHYNSKAVSAERDGALCDMGRCCKKSCIAYPMARGTVKEIC